MIKNLILGMLMHTQLVHYDFSQGAEMLRIPHVQAPQQSATCAAERAAHDHLRESLFNMMQSDVRIITLRIQDGVRWITFQEVHSGRNMVKVLLQADVLRPTGTPSWCD